MPLPPELIKSLISSNQRSSTYIYHPLRKHYMSFIWRQLLFESHTFQTSQFSTGHSLNLDITFQIRQFGANHTLNSGCKFFNLFMSNNRYLMVIFPTNLLMVRFLKSLFYSNVLHSSFMCQHAHTHFQHHNGTVSLSFGWQSMLLLHMLESMTSRVLHLQKKKSRSC